MSVGLWHRRELIPMRAGMLEIAVAAVLALATTVGGRQSVAAPLAREAGNHSLMHLRAQRHVAPFRRAPSFPALGLLDPGAEPTLGRPETPAPAASSAPPPVDERPTVETAPCGVIVMRGQPSHRFAN